MWKNKNTFHTAKKQIINEKGNKQSGACGERRGKRFYLLLLRKIFYKVKANRKNKESANEVKANNKVVMGVEK